MDEKRRQKLTLALGIALLPPIWAVLAPAFATILTVMVFNYLGDCVRDVLDVEAEK